MVKDKVQDEPMGGELMGDPPAAIICTPTSPRAKIDVCRVDLNDLSTTDKCQLVFKQAGVEVGRSYVFVGASDGTHTFNSYIWPAAAACTITVVKTADQSTVGSPLSVTVQ